MPHTVLVMGGIYTGVATPTEAAGVGAFGALVLGMFLHGIGMRLLTVPVVVPVIEELGIHPIVFGVLVVRMIEIGLITPPVGPDSGASPRCSDSTQVSSTHVGFIPHCRRAHGARHVPHLAVRA